MKRISIIATVLALLVGCNVNESKEGRITDLESHADEMKDRLQALETKVETLESPADEETD